MNRVRDGVYDNRITERREWYEWGRVINSTSKETIQKSNVNTSKSWGSFPDVVSRATVQLYPFK